MYFIASNQIVKDLRAESTILRKSIHRRPRKPFWAQPIAPGPVRTRVRTASAASRKLGISKELLRGRLLTAVVSHAQPNPQYCLNQSSKPVSNVQGASQSFL